MKGKEIWMRVFNTDLEEGVLADIQKEKNFEDEGTDEENKEIVEALEGWTLSKVVDVYFYYNGDGVDSSVIRGLFDMLQIKLPEELEE